MMSILIARRQDQGEGRRRALLRLLSAGPIGRFLLLLVTVARVSFPEVSYASEIGENAPAVTDAVGIRDPFGALREPITSPDEEYWFALGDALRQLDTLEGASYSREFGVLTLHGEPAAAGHGPFHLDDFMVALRWAFFQREDLSVSIDPDPDDPKAPIQSIKYYGGCEDTALGWLMFECDRILKSCAQGRDSLTKVDLDLNVPDYHNMHELGYYLSDMGSKTDRFWITFGMEDSEDWRKKPKRSDGWQPVICETPDGTSISVEHCRLYVRTELMSGPRGGKGEASKAALAFANHFTNHYDEFAAIFPELDRLKRIAPLLPVAEWIAKENVPIDLDFVRNYQQQASVQTPKETPAIVVSAVFEDSSPSRGRVTTESRAIGGVDFSPHTFFAGDRDGNAKSHGLFSKDQLNRHRRETTWTAEMDGKTLRVATVPTLRTRHGEIPTHLEKGVQLRPPKKRSEARGDLFPDTPPELLVVANRMEQVPVEQISLNTLDQARSQPIRGPPLQIPRVFQDQRHVPQADRISTVGVEVPRLRRPAPGDVDFKSPPSHGPEAVDAFPYRPMADRISAVGAESVPLTPQLPGGNRVRGPPEAKQAAEKIPEARSTAERIPSVSAEAMALSPMVSGGNRGYDPPEGGGVAERISGVGTESIPLGPLLPGDNGERAPPSSGNESGQVTGPMAASDGGQAGKGEPHHMAEHTETVGVERSALGSSVRSEARTGDRMPGLPLFADRSGGMTFNFPRLQKFEDVHTTRSIEVQGRPGTTTTVPRQLALVSPLKDITVEFGPPKIDQARASIVYPPAPSHAAVVKGYYPKDNVVELSDGTRIGFDEEGFPKSLTTSEKELWEFFYRDTAPPDLREPIACRLTSVSENGEREEAGFSLVDTGVRVSPEDLEAEAEEERMKISVSQVPPAAPQESGAGDPGHASSSGGKTMPPPEKAKPGEEAVLPPSTPVSMPGLPEEITDDPGDFVRTCRPEPGKVTKIRLPRVEDKPITMEVQPHLTIYPSIDKGTWKVTLKPEGADAGEAGSSSAGTILSVRRNEYFSVKPRQSGGELNSKGPQVIRLRLDSLESRPRRAARGANGFEARVEIEWNDGGQERKGILVFPFKVYP